MFFRIDKSVLFLLFMFPVLNKGKMKLSKIELGFLKTGWYATYKCSGKEISLLFYKNSAIMKINI
jgi:hypothetical protein